MHRRMRMVGFLMKKIYADFLKENAGKKMTRMDIFLALGLSRHTHISETAIRDHVEKTGYGRGARYLIKGCGQ